jgi:hypothetical protein
MTRHAIDNREEEHDPHHHSLFCKFCAIAGHIVVGRKLILLKCKLRVVVICSQGKCWHEKYHADQGYYSEENGALFQKSQVKQSLTATSIFDLLVCDIVRCSKPREVAFESVPASQWLCIFILGFMKTSLFVFDISSECANQIKANHGDNDYEDIESIEE